MLSPCVATAYNDSYLGCIWITMGIGMEKLCLTVAVIAEKQVLGKNS